MRSGADASRWVLVSALGLTALVKVKHFLIERDWALIYEPLAHPATMGVLCTVELILAVALFRGTRFAAWTVAGLCIGGALVAAAIRHGTQAGAQCGCLGRVPLTYEQHALFLGVMFLLAAHVLWQRPRPVSGV